MNRRNSSVHIVFPQLPDKLEFVEIAQRNAFPLGGRCPSAHTGADEGLTYRKSPPHRIRRTTSNLSTFPVSAEEISTFPLIRHGFAVPPSPEGEGLAQHLCKHQFIGQLSKTDKHKFLYGKFLRRGVSSWVGPTIETSCGRAVKGEKEACWKPPFISVVFPGSRGSGR